MEMNQEIENPYAPPASLETAQAVMLKELESLLCIARTQHRLIFCILGFLVAIVSLLILGSTPEWIRVAAIGLVVASALGCWIFFTILSYRLSGLRVAVIVGLCFLIPFVGFFVMLVMNSKASWLLRKAGFKTGIFGADTKSIPERFSNC